MGIRAGWLAWAMVAALACGSSTAPPPPFVGTYHLVKVNGAPLPVSLGNSTRYDGGTLRLDASGSYLLLLEESVAGHPELASTLRLSGSWTVSGSDITLLFGVTSAVSAVATYVPPDLTVSTGGVTYDFLAD